MRVICQTTLRKLRIIRSNFVYEVGEFSFMRDRRVVVFGWRMRFGRRAMETLELPALSEEARVGERRGRRGVEAGLLWVLVGLIAVDRGILCWQFLFKYFDQDQALIWYAARELMRGHFHEP